MESSKLQLGEMGTQERGGDRGIVWSSIANYISRIASASTTVYSTSQIEWFHHVREPIKKASDECRTREAGHTVRHPGRYCLFPKISVSFIVQHISLMVRSKGTHDNNRCCFQKRTRICIVRRTNTGIHDEQLSPCFTSIANEGSLLRVPRSILSCRQTTVATPSCVHYDDRPATSNKGPGP